MTPEEVPDDLIDAFDKGSYERSCAYAGVSQIDGEKEYFRGGIAAVYDAIEARVIAKVAADARFTASQFGRSEDQCGDVGTLIAYADRLDATARGER